MAKKIENNGLQLRATDRAYEKLKEIINGSKDKINEFIKKITKDGINRSDFSLFLQNKQQEFYYNKCKNIYVIFVFEEKVVTFVDFLTELEFNETKGIKK